MKKYSQEGYRDSDGDVIIRQYGEVQRSSGLIVPYHLSTIAVVSQIPSSELVNRMDVKFHYSPGTSPVDDSSVDDPSPLALYSVDPHDARRFCELSVLTIVSGYRALTYHGVSPSVNFMAAGSLDEMNEDDRLTIQSIADTVLNTVRNVNQVISDDDVKIGQYL